MAKLIGEALIPGAVIAENPSGPVSVILPSGTNPSQTIRARDFGSMVPIRVRWVPESGDATTYVARHKA